jgi:acyl-CoA thioester hydrolase
MINLTLADIESFPITCSAVVLEDWLDEMGHMNVMWYTHLFSQATCGFFASWGLTEEYMKENQSGAFALDCHLKYLRELHVGKRIHTRSCAIDRSEKRFRTMHFIVNEDDGCIASVGEFIGAHIDMSKRRMSPIPEHIGQQFDKQISHRKSLGREFNLCKTIKL